MSKHVATRSVADMLAELDVRDLTHDFEVVAKKHQVTLAEVMGPRKMGGTIEARQECYSMLRGLGWSWPRIGQLFDRDHRTIMGGVKAHERRVAKAAT